MIIDEIQLWSAAELGVSAELFATFSLSQVTPTQSYILESVTGLDPDQIAPVYYGGWTGNNANDKYFSMNLPPRAIALKVKLNPQIGLSETYSSLREHLYKIISKSRTSQVELRFRYNSQTLAVIKGLVQRFESSLFDSSPRVQISIGCPDPMFKSISYIVEPDPDITYPTLYQFSVEDTLSTAPHGFQMKMEIQGWHVDYLKINTVVSGGYDNQAFLIQKAFSPGDIIYLSSEEDNKYLYFDRGATRTHLTDKISAGSFWPIMFPGDNTYKLTAPPSPGQTEQGGHTVTLEEFKYKTYYWGV